MKNMTLDLGTNRVDTIRKELYSIDNIKNKLYYLAMTNSLVFSNTLATDKEKLDWLEESQAVLEELVNDLYGSKVL